MKDQDLTQKLFPLDKNSILKEAQLIQRTKLLNFLVKEAVNTYLKFHNPLGLVDDTIRRIHACNKYEISHLYEFYFDLCGIYRFKTGDNQLEIIWDGVPHFEKYTKDWEKAFKDWIRDFCKYRNFLKAILEAAIFHHGKEKALRTGNRFKVFLGNYFQLKVYKYKGIQEYNAA